MDPTGSLQRSLDLLAGFKRLLHRGEREEEERKEEERGEDQEGRDDVQLEQSHCLAKVSPVQKSYSTQYNSNFNKQLILQTFLLHSVRQLA